MKITKRQLKRIIQEELQRLAEMETWDETQAGQVTDHGDGGQMDALNKLENDVKSAVIAAVRSGVSPDNVVSSITGFLGREYPAGTVTPEYMS